MKRRDFLKSMAAMIGWFSVGCMPAKESAKEAPKEKGRRGYYHILLISDLHLPLRTKQYPEKAVQKDIWQKKLMRSTCVPCKSWNACTFSWVGCGYWPGPPTQAPTWNAKAVIGKIPNVKSSDLNIVASIFKDCILFPYLN